MGWYIMGYESEALISHIWIKNRSYILNFKMSTFVYWSLYLLPHVLTSSPHVYDSYRYPLCPRAQLPFVTMVPLRCNGGLHWTKILGAYSAGLSELRGISLRPLFPPFISGSILSPGCSHLFPVSLFLVSTENTSSFAGTISAS